MPWSLNLINLSKHFYITVHLLVIPIVQVICFKLGDTESFDTRMTQQMQAYLLKMQQTDRYTIKEVGQEFDQSRVLRFKRPSLGDNRRGIHRKPQLDSNETLVEEVAKVVHTTAYEWGVQQRGWAFSLLPPEEQVEHMQIVSYNQGGWYKEHQVCSAHARHIFAV